jgi:hypothetical protein
MEIASDFIQNDPSSLPVNSEEATEQANEPVIFKGYFASCMEMYANSAEVAHYLDSHPDWFQRCALPMKAEPLGPSGYTLIIGRFGSFGYDVEPKIGLHLLPQDQGIYRIETIPVPGYASPGYDVDFQASLELAEADPQTVQAGISQQQAASLSALTRVEWELHLTVAIKFPRFIHTLPKSLIQKTGDRLLNQIVRQASRCLTHKVQEDFHSSRGIPFPQKSRKKHWQWGHKALHHVIE